MRFSSCARLLVLLAPVSMWAQPVPLTEASGIARQGDVLLIVDDGRPGRYFRYRLDNAKGPVIPLAAERLESVELSPANLATDLEAIDVLADGRIAILSERLRALFGTEGMIGEYGARLSEFGKRGLEGLAVRNLEGNVSQVAVLWEGGYPEYDDVQEQFRDRVGRIPLRPVVQIHRLLPGDQAMSIRGTFIELDVPVPEGRPPQAQRFRAPDLVWHRGADGNLGFIVLLSSLNSEGKREYRYHWLQRFAMNGARIGEPIDLDQIVPSTLKGANWEGLDWFEEGEKLIFVHESHPKLQAYAYVLEIPEAWKHGDSAVAARFTHRVQQETAYYLATPAQARAPDGHLPAGTRVAMLRAAGSYSLVRTEDALEAYVDVASLRPHGED